MKSYSSCTRASTASSAIEPSRKSTRLSPGIFYRSADSRLSTTRIERGSAARRSLTRLLPTKPAPPVTRIEVPASSRTGLFRRRRDEVRERVRDAAVRVVLDRPPHAFAQRRARAPREILVGFRRIEEDRRDVVGISRPDLDRLVQLHVEGGECFVEQFLDGVVRSRGHVVGAFLSGTVDRLHHD